MEINDEDAEDDKDVKEGEVYEDENNEGTNTMTILKMMIIMRSRLVTSFFQKTVI